MKELLGHGPVVTRGGRFGWFGSDLGQRFQGTDISFPHRDPDPPKCPNPVPKLAILTEVKRFKSLTQVENG